MDIRIFAPDEMIETQIALPLSKSMTNRAQILNALTSGVDTSEGTDTCDDTSALANALRSEPKGTINIGAAGTAMRFLTAYFAALPGADIVLDGVARMRERPIAPLVDALRALGADISYLGSDGFAPIHIHGQALNGGAIEIDASVSSQFISAILMISPTFNAPLSLTLKGEVYSWPYINMTIEMMRHRGIEVVRDLNTIIIAPGQYKPIAKSDIESDWSAASYWYSIAALSAGWISLPALSYPSLQGDSRLAKIFSKLGVITTEIDGGVELSASPEVYSRIDENLSDCPDIVQTLAVACCMLGVPFKFSGVSSLRLKETDRIEALCKEMLKLSCIIEVENADTIKWDGKRAPVHTLPVIETYGDHRMAMAFAPAALYASGMVIKDHEVVSKSYPNFWNDLQHAGFVVCDASIPIDTKQS